ncbi:PAS/PAC sensor signal transduction histidine kinase [Natrinema pellirubrum DSM 15624]|uniref:histidine kinase n=2 Tax=Natrinema pellirubrum TaxID=69525 RepID=L0JHU1_NATP1|nr:PAS domain S-box [Natrinema pellirubrum DSM 15624]ELY69848.1 PAS/PAC sensor signal transduction histidine kinase [Natrinema pellirubrum DSM 15624]
MFALRTDLIDVSIRMTEAGHDGEAGVDDSTVQLLLAADDRRTMVQALLSDRYELVIGGPVADADLFVVDSDRFSEYAPLLRERTADRPAFTPVILLRRDSHTDDIAVADPSESDEPQLVNAVVDAPLDPDRLRRRVHSLLVRRHQSLTLLADATTGDERPRQNPLERAAERPGRTDSDDTVDTAVDLSTDRDGTGRPVADDRYEAIFNRTSQFTGLLEPDGMILEANDTALAFAGLDRDDVVGRPFWEADWFDRSASLREQTKRDVERAADGEFVRRTIEMQGTDDTAIIDFSIRPIRDDSGDVTLLVPEGREITSLKERERDLRRYQRRFEAVFEDPKTLVGLLEPDGTLVQANETAMAAIDTDLESIVGEPFWDTPWWPDDARADVREWTDRAAAGEYVDYERDHVGTDGTFTATGTIRPVTNAAGEVVSLIASAHDITERKERERELERTNEQLERFASIVSHDLRNPLNVLAGWLEQAEATGDPKPFEHCHEAVDRMDRLIDDLLTLARQGEQVDAIDAVDLERVVSDCWQSVETGSATLRTDVSGSIHADETRLRQLLENLFRNAVEHGSTSPASHAQQDAVEHGSTNPDSQAHQGDVEHGESTVSVSVGPLEDGFYVADDGAGIPTDERERVFENGYSTASDGTGFGLSIVATIAEAHGWDVRVTESPSGGARFEFTGVTVTD